MFLAKLRSLALLILALFNSTEGFVIPSKTTNVVLWRQSSYGTFIVPLPHLSSSSRLAPSNMILVGHEEVAATVSFGNAVFDTVFLSTEFWSATIMLSIVALLYVWEEGIQTLREKLPKTLMPVLDSVLAEMGGLGFIGLFLSIFVTDGLLGHVVEEASEHFLGDEEILLETFEFLHTAFFEVGIGFFTIAGLTVLKVLKKVESLTTVSEAIFDSDKNGDVCLEELAEILGVEALEVDVNYSGRLSTKEVTNAIRKATKTSFLDEVFMTTEQVKAEALVVRERLMQTYPLSSSFRIENYFERIFGENLREIVELSPIAWLPLIPPISVGRSVDMSRGIISASSPNAADSCGYFLGTPPFLFAATTFSVLGVVWCLWNFWKMAQIKEMLVPTLVRDTTSGIATLLPPRYEDSMMLEEFDSSPGVFGMIESAFSKGVVTSSNKHERLFGAIGASGPEFYRQSIKLHTWTVVSQIVFFGGQIVVRDVGALSNGLVVGNPDLLLPELAVFGFFVALAAGQLWLAPQTFLNYCLVTSIESFAADKMINEKMCQEDMLLNDDEQLLKTTT